MVVEAKGEDEIAGRDVVTVVGVANALGVILVRKVDATY